MHLRQLFGAEILCLLLVDVLHKHSLVLENVALHLQVQAMITEVEQFVDDEWQKMHVFTLDSQVTINLL
jgi:hypothetical protein